MTPSYVEPCCPVQPWALKGEGGADGSIKGKHTCLSRCQLQRHDHVSRVWCETVRQYEHVWGQSWWKNLQRPMPCLHCSLSGHLRLSPTLSRACASARKTVAITHQRRGRAHCGDVT